MLKRVKEKYYLPDDFILFVGLIEPRKNVGLLIEAFAKLISKDSQFGDQSCNCRPLGLGIQFNNGIDNKS